MPDPRTTLRDLLWCDMHDAATKRDQAWADYWQRRRVVVVPDVEATNQVFNRHAEIAAMTEAVGTVMVGAMDREILMREGPAKIRDCIARLKAARDKESTNRNLSTLLAVVVKVQRDLEALLNGSRAE